MPSRTTPSGERVASCQRRCRGQRVIARGRPSCGGRCNAPSATARASTGSGAGSPADRHGTAQRAMDEGTAAEYRDRPRLAQSCAWPGPSSSARGPPLRPRSPRAAVRSSPQAGTVAGAVAGGIVLRECGAMTIHAVLQPLAPYPEAPYPEAREAGEAVVRGHGIVKRFGAGASAVDALRGVDVAFERGSFTAIMGPSGSGKSTLLHILAGLDAPTEGWVEIAGTRLDRLKDRELTLLRRREVGFVFQSYNLLPVLSAEENITLPLRIGGARVDREWLDTLVDAVGLSDRRTHRPAEMSGGQQQRVAVARALITRPAVVFGDEPTGNLDSVSSREILEHMRRAVNELGQTIFIVTHVPSAATFADRFVFLSDGLISGVEERPTIDTILDRLR